ncbi:hypothetical protein, unlikely [Trypanosoma brucei brucei TREU927]|uniref:Uncharacterized protein n=1 Tax=Trypanosoma brucei brucei (strain 927/4 GUTat10.1) TaxID=185431 RepID=Q8IFH9_TRYB2|nr:hypothetical protein, unlikely [Trypanosoma brucei brucei TREU927]CAD53028.1 hypothetical protein, unlikely [Trypanosoma brucei brucei TREU927]
MSIIHYSLQYNCKSFCIFTYFLIPSYWKCSTYNIPQYRSQNKNNFISFCIQFLVQQCVLIIHKVFNLPNTSLRNYFPQINKQINNQTFLNVVVKRKLNHGKLWGAHVMGTMNASLDIPLWIFTSIINLLFV